MKILNRQIISILFLLVLFLGAGCSSQDDYYDEIELNWQEPDSIFNINSEYIAVIGDIQECTILDKMVYYILTYIGMGKLNTHLPVIYNYE